MNDASAAARKETNWWQWALLALAIGVGAFFRLHTLGVRSLNPAEAFSVLVARQPWPQFLRTMWWGEGNMAFYYMLLRGWLAFGDSDGWVTCLSAVLGVLTIPAIYFLGGRFLSRNVGLIAAGLLAVHSFHIGRSESARSYSLLTLLVILSTYAFLKLVESPERKELWMLYVLLSALAVYAQTFTVFILFAQWLALGPRGLQRVGLLKMLIAGIAVVVLALPLLAVMMTQNKGQLDWVPRLSFNGVLNVLWGIAGADILDLRSPTASALLLALYAVAWVLAVWGIGRRKGEAGPDPGEKVAVSVFLWSFLFPFIMMSVVSLWKPILYPRYLLMCVPAALLLASQGIVSIARYLPIGRAFAGIALAGVLGLSYAGTREFDRRLPNSGQDWRGVTKYILAHRAPSDAVIFYTFGGDWTWDYYVSLEKKEGDKAPMPKVIFPLAFDSAKILNTLEPYPRVWVGLQQDLPSPASDANNALLIKTMREHFQVIEEKQFTGETIYPGEEVTIDLALYAATPQSH